ncbi:hypothetical protein NUW58_g7237 [Xylaria curta]|uniref:Uncharacterized protein n=1 Tax=Xylaria curta TaxID=42375 RepID=A0ACC1NK56_9PEZI|nr:hypothetical protein NUW58_g7237 [Xylaria curta]
MAAGNSITDNFAPNWLPFFSPDGDMVPDLEFKVECQICRSLLAIAEPPDDGGSVEAFTVLPAAGQIAQAAGTRSSSTISECVIGDSLPPNCPGCSTHSHLAYSPIDDGLDGDSGEASEDEDEDDDDDDEDEDDDDDDEGFLDLDEIQAIIEDECPQLRHLPPQQRIAITTQLTNRVRHRLGR